MILQEQYEALLRRGMPELERLFFQAPDEDPPHGWYVVGTDDNFRVAESDARDLVTMQALRWWLSLGGKFGDRPRRQVHLIEIDPSSVVCRINTPNHGSCGPEWEASEAIETILAATAHLEPKTT